MFFCSHYLWSYIYQWKICLSRHQNFSQNFHPKLSYVPRNCDSHTMYRISNIFENIVELFSHSTMICTYIFSSYLIKKISFHLNTLRKHSFTWLSFTWKYSKIENLIIVSIYSWVSEKPPWSKWQKDTQLTCSLLFHPS